MSRAPDLQPGIYGKLPSNGDFVRRRLPAAFVEPWDMWLQESLSASQDQLGTRWLDTYLISPIWRFVLSAGCAGQSAWAGLLMPSVDRVGRYFPLTLACPLPAASGPLGFLDAAKPWYDSAEKVMLACLEQNLELPELDRQVGALGLPPSETPAIPRFSTATSAQRMPLPTDPVALCYSSLLPQLLQELYFAYSFWWSTGSDVVDPSLLLCQGLPPSAGFSGMLAGDWAQWGWNLAKPSSTEDVARSRGES